MKLPVRLRWTEFLIAITAVVALLVFTERSAWRRISRLHNELKPETIDRVRFAEKLRSAVVEMHTAWKLAAESENATNRAWLEAASTRVETLLRPQLADPAAPQELLEKIEAEHRAYQTLVQARRTEPKAAGLEHERDLEIDGQASRLLALCEELGSANDAAAQKVLNEANTGLSNLHQSLLLSLVGLVFCGATVLILLYRGMVGPLRTSLAESRTLIDRQEKLASLGVFAAGIAHEIRNPLTAIKVRLFTLKDGHPPGSSDREDLEVIASEINRLERIVQEFLRFARPAEPDLLKVPIDDFLREVHALMQPELQKKGILFKLELSANEIVQIDPEKMKQVLINLVHNAAESISGQGAVTLKSRTDRRMVDGHLLPAVVIEVSDTGKGIPPEVQKRLFDPFFTTKERGTGLGLPIAARIVEKHGGLMQYHTQLNEGTTFSILLPKANL